MSIGLGTLEEVVGAEAFVEADLSLRRGRHVDRDDAALYAFLSDAQEVLETFYRRFGCELVHKTDGYFYLLPTSDRLGRRHLSPAEMLVGQALTLLLLDPSTVTGGGLVTRDQVLAQLAGVMGTAPLLRALNPKRKRVDERVAEQTARGKVAEALRRLESLGFVDLLEAGQVRLRASLMRFAEPVRGAAAPELALERLVREGELVLTDTAADDDDGAQASDVSAGRHDDDEPDEPDESDEPDEDDDEVRDELRDEDAP